MTPRTLRTLLPAAGLAVALLVSSLSPAAATPYRQPRHEAPALVPSPSPLAFLTTAWRLLGRGLHGLFTADSAAGAANPGPLPGSSGGSGAGVGGDPDGVH